MVGLVTLRCFHTAGLVALPNVFESSDTLDFKSLFYDAWLRRPPLRPAPERLQALPAHRLHVPDVWLEPLGRLRLWRPGLRLGAQRSFSLHFAQLFLFASTLASGPLPFRSL